MSIQRCMPFNFPTLMALYFAITCGLWYIFKLVEPRLFPVISEFTITSQIEYEDRFVLSGTFIKNRQCVLGSILAYDDTNFITVLYPSPYGQHSSRLVGYQSFSNWGLTPKSDKVTLYATHECTTGLVVTTLTSATLRRTFP
jgi:hypothetical protein